MRSLLNALQDGRLLELPDNDKDSCLRYLAHLIEAIPEMSGHGDIADGMLAQENMNNTGIGKGVACPHLRRGENGDLTCAVGWSPTGIDYGARDNEKVHLVVMYYIPDSQKNTYLKEVSSLVKAIQKQGGIQSIAKANDLGTVREQLLDWVSAALEAGVPETKARMIRLEAREAVIAGGETIATGLTQAPFQVFPVLILSYEDKMIALCQNPELAASLENDPTLTPLLKQNAQFDRQGFHFVFRGTTLVDPRRPLYDYLAIKIL